ncbi:MAG: hypothetical protein AAGF95_16740 [Chloroflexota bacterium]
MRFNRRNLVGTLIVSTMVFAGTSGSTTAQTPDPQIPEMPPYTVNHATEFRPDLGTLRSGLIPGVDGYKVFHPGAIAVAQAQPGLNINDSSTSGSGKWRRARTDAYDTALSMVSDHSSDSDLSENKIEVEGLLGMKGGPKTEDCKETRYDRHVVSCSNSTGGPEGRYEGVGFHDFHTDGYGDTHLKTNNFADRN